MHAYIHTHTSYTMKQLHINQPYCKYVQHNSMNQKLHTRTNKVAEERMDE